LLPSGRRACLRGSVVRSFGPADADIALNPGILELYG
jgi:hypothetical protein